MGYYEAINMIFGIIYIVFSLIMVHFIVFGIVGLFHRKRYPKTDRINRYGVIIPARNEENVVGGLIESVQKNNYPQDKLQIFVIAHNCTDRTAEIARSMGAMVYEYNNPEENTMGYAFRHLFSCIERDYGTQNYDGFFLFNADNVLDQNYFSRMNDAFEYYDKRYVITSYRNSKNFGSNLLSGLYGIYFLTGCRMESCGRTALGCSTRVQGTGYVINSNLVKNGWDYVSLTEDWEFSADQVLMNNRIRYCDDAIFYDEQPTSFRIMWRQRVRWSRGHLLVFCARAKDLLRSLFSREVRHKYSLYDLTTNMIPSSLIWFALFLLQLVLLLITPLVSPGVSFQEIFLRMGDSFWNPAGLLWIWLRNALFSTVILMISAAVIFVTERKRIKNVSLGKKILVSLFWPLFLAIQLPMDIQALFSKNLGWKPIPHADKTTFDKVNEGFAEEEAI